MTKTHEQMVAEAEADVARFERECFLLDPETVQYAMYRHDYRKAKARLETLKQPAVECEPFGEAK